MLNSRQTVAWCAILILIGIAIASAVFGGVNLFVIVLCGVGVMLGSIYIWHGGRTPKRLRITYNLLGDVSLSGGELLDDRDPRNLPMRITLPLLALAAAIAWWFFMPALLRTAIPAFHPLRIGWIALALVFGLAMNLGRWRRDR